MKKKNILNLIKYYSEKNDPAFRDEAYEIANDFEENGDHSLAEYIIALLSNNNAFVPQFSAGGDTFTYLRKIEINQEPLPLPEPIKEDFMGIVNAIGYHAGVNKFLFEGAPGTGKTESVKQLARLTNRLLYAVDFEIVIDSKLGQTSKNIAALFDEINRLNNPYEIIVLFDEIDALAMNRTDANDLREMGRATSSLLKGFDTLNESVTIVATTNLFNGFDKALVRRFDAVINFNRYTQKDLTDIAEIILDYYLPKFKYAYRDIRLFRKIIGLMDPIPYPGDLKNIIKTSLAFGNPVNPYSYLIRLYQTINGADPTDIVRLQEQGFTVREIEKLSGVSRSQASRVIKRLKNE